MSEPRKHHFVPQWYMRQFGTRREIGVYDKALGTFSVEHPKDVAYITGLNDLEHPELPRSAIEELLGRVENDAATAVRKAISSGLNALSRDERFAFAAFVAAQQLRVPSHRRALGKAVMDKLARHRALLSDAAIQSMSERRLTAEEIKAIRGAQLSDNEPSGLVGGGIMMFLQHHADELLADFRWDILKVNNPHLITSDTPVKALTDKDDAGNPTYLADLPIDGSHVLVLRSGGDSQALAKYGGFDAWCQDERGQPSCQHFQKLSLARADRFVFGHPDNPIWTEIGVER